MLRRSAATHTVRAAGEDSDTSGGGAVTTACGAAGRSAAAGGCPAGAIGSAGEGRVTGGAAATGGGAAQAGGASAIAGGSRRPTPRACEAPTGAMGAEAPDRGLGMHSASCTFSSCAKRAKVAAAQLA